MVVVDEHKIRTSHDGEELTVDWFIRNAKGSCVEMFRYCGIEGSDEDLDSMYQRALEITSKEHPPILYEGIDNLIIDMNKLGRAQSIVSSHPLSRLENDLEMFGIKKYFDQINGNVHSKADTIKRVVEGNNHNPNKVMYIGDTVSDMRAAKEAGVYPVAVSYGYQPEKMLIKERPQFITPNVEGLSFFLTLNT